MYYVMNVCQNKWYAETISLYLTLLGTVVDSEAERAKALFLRRP